nr:hypothetical protein [Bradyrhizobium diazoefficiens]
MVCRSHNKPTCGRLESARNRRSSQIGNDDVVIYEEFDNETKLAACKSHDLYQESIRRNVKSLRIRRRSLLLSGQDHNGRAPHIPQSICG